MALFRRLPPAALTSPPVAGEMLYPIQQKQRWGYMNRKGHLVVPPTYDEAGDFHEGRAAVANRYLWTDPVHSGTTQWRSRCGYIDLSGKLIIPLQYAEASAFRQGRARVLTREPRSGEQRYGFIDTVGRPVIPPLYADAEEFSEGLAGVRLEPEGGVGFIDTSGKMVISPRFFGIHRMRFSEGLAWARTQADGGGEERDGFIDRSGRWAIPAVYSAARSFSEGLAQVRRNAEDPWGFIDKTGKTVFTTRGQEGHAFSEGLAAVQVVQEPGREVWQYVDRTGKVVLPNLRYRFVGIFREGVAFVEDDRLGWGLIDRTGKVLLKPQLTGVSLFHHGLARVETGAFFRGVGVGYIDTQGKWVWKPQK